MEKNTGERAREKVTEGGRQANRPAHTAAVGP